MKPDLRTSICLIMDEVIDIGWLHQVILGQISSRQCEKTTAYLIQLLGVVDFYPNTRINISVSNPPRLQYLYRRMFELALALRFEQVEPISPYELRVNQTTYVFKLC